MNGEFTGEVERNSGELEEQEWKRRFKMKCGKCGFLMTVPKMKQEAKRDAKNAKK